MTIDEVPHGEPRAAALGLLEEVPDVVTELERPRPGLFDQGAGGTVERLALEQLEGGEHGIEGGAQPVGRLGLAVRPLIQQRLGGTPCLVGFPRPPDHLLTELLLVAPELAGHPLRDGLRLSSGPTLALEPTLQTGDPLAIRSSFLAMGRRHHQDAGSVTPEAAARLVDGPLVAEVVAGT